MVDPFLPSVNRDYFNYRYATWNREEQFDQLKIRGNNTITWKFNVLGPDVPGQLPGEFMSHTLIYPNGTNPSSVFVLPPAGDFINFYKKINLIESGAGVGWTVINNSQDSTLRLELNVNVKMFDGSLFIDLPPRMSKEYFVQIDDDITGVTIFDYGGSTQVGPTGPQGPAGPDVTGDPGPRGPQGPQGPQGAPGHNPPREGYAFIHPNAAVDVTALTNKGLFFPSTSPSQGVANGILSPVPRFTPLNYEGLISSVYPLGRQAIFNGNPIAFVYPLSSIVPFRLGANLINAGVSIRKLTILVNVCFTPNSSAANTFEFSIFQQTITQGSVFLTQSTSPLSISSASYNGYLDTTGNVVTFKSTPANTTTTPIYNNNANPVNGAFVIELSQPILLYNTTTLPETNLIFVYSGTENNQLVTFYGLGLDLNYQLTE